MATDGDQSRSDTPLYRPHCHLAERERQAGMVRPSVRLSLVLTDRRFLDSELQARL